jgi:hypothetical protein
LFSNDIEPAGLRSCNPGYRFLCPDQARTKAYPKAPPRLSHPVRTDADPPHSTGPAPFRPKQHSDTRNAAPPPSKRTVSMKYNNTGFQCFPLNNFKYFLTLFSKFFSSFPHGTCSLSVSCQYLALDELYHPLIAAPPNNTTLRTHVVRTQCRIKDGILTLYDVSFQRTYTRTSTDRASLGYNSRPEKAAIFKLSSSRFTRRY